MNRSSVVSNCSISCLLQGGGRLTLSAAALAEGKCLPAITLTDQGQVTRIRIMTHTAGTAQPIWPGNCQVFYSSLGCLLSTEGHNQQRQYDNALASCSTLHAPSSCWKVAGSCGSMPGPHCCCPKSAVLCQGASISGGLGCRREYVAWK